MGNPPDDKTILSEGRVLGPYKLLKQIGAGGMGVVFQARDTERNTLVALKTLHKLDPLALLKLKNEFRSTANVLHPNLVMLHELMREEDVWFFTMEYVEGESLATLLKRAADTSRQDSPLVSMETVTSARADSPLTPPDTETRTSIRSGAFADTLPSPQASRTHEETLTSMSKPDANALTTDAFPATEAQVALASEEALAETRPLLELEKLRHVFSELALGICALHEAGKLHCDIKPGNVMVAEDGRVVLLDFGLVTERVQDKSRGDAVLAGTPAYMAPEQVAGEPASEASDWYALGVMIYEALCGRRPFGSDSALREKLQRTAPPLPASVHIPEDLRELCMALLNREPAARPSGREVLERLRGERAQATPSEPAQEVRALLGRQEHLAALGQAYQAMRTGNAVTLHVHGRSGMGKTALLQRFLGELRRQEGVVVLHGRCYERESVPYKAFDELVDSLTRYLQSLPSRQLRELLPENVAELARAFPVLRQLPGLSRMPEQLPGGQEQSDLRRRAFRALKELLSRLAREVVLVLHIDDLQWGEQDSFALLNELITPPEAPSLLLLCSFRTEEAEASGLLTEHRRLRTVLGDRVDIRELEIGPLSEADATHLAASLLGSPTDPRAPGIAREAHGNPFFVEELTRYALTTDTTAPSTTSPTDAVTLEQVILSRVSRLPERARGLLEVVAVAGRRIAQGVATRAAEVSTDVHVLWNMLRNGSLVQTRGPRDADPVECYHDRIRESVHANLPSDRLKAHHHKLAELLEAAGDSEPEALARHYMNAGMRDKAGSYLTQAADRAAEALAFEQAAQLYALALECLPGERALKVKRANALMNAGRCAESAPVFLDAAQGAPADEEFELRLRAAERLLTSGHIDEGEALLRPLLGQLRLPYPTTSKQAMVGLVGRSILLSLRGTRFQERAEAQVPPELLRAVDATWAAGQVLTTIDYIRGGYFTLRSAHLALKAGEPLRVARSLAILGVVAFYRGRSADIVRGKRLIAEAEQIARRLGEQRLLAFTRLALATSHAMQSQWRASNELLQEGLHILETKCTGVGWELSSGRASYLSALWYRGEFDELALRSTTWLRHAMEVGDLYGGIFMRLYQSQAALAADAPSEAERILDEALALQEKHTKLFTGQLLTGLLLKAEANLYRGESARALEQLDAKWKDASAFFSASFVHCLALHIRGTVMLTLARENPTAREKLLARVEKDAAKLRRENPTFGRAPEALLRAGLALTRGQQVVALSQLDIAIEAYEKGEMMLRAACARRRKGELLGGEQGRALVEAADTAIRAQGIRDVERWTRMYNALPGSAG